SGAEGRLVNAARPGPGGKKAACSPTPEVGLRRWRVAARPSNGHEAHEIGGPGGGKGRRRRVALGPSGSRRPVGRVQVGGGGVSPGSAIACEPRRAIRPRERGWIAKNRNRLDCARAAGTRGSSPRRAAVSGS